LKDEGYILTAVYDSEPSKRTSLGNELRCEAAATPTRVAECSDTILTVISDDAGMRHIFSPQRSDSLLTHAQGRLFINCATLSPQVHRDIETLLEQHGGHSLEACMAGSITQARNGTLYLMCGGKVEAFERAQLLLASLGSSIRHIGGAGEAAKVKALVNMVMNINTAGLAEGLGLGAALGLDLKLLREVFAQTGANSRVLETDGEDMQNREHSCFFSAAHAAKDSGIGLELARELGLDLPLARATKEQYERMIAEGLGELDKSGIAELTFKDRHKHSGDRV